MFDLWGQSVEVPLPGVDLPDVEIPAKERLAWEKELLGVYLSEHPFTQASRQLVFEVDVFCGQIGEEMIGQTIITAGLVTSVRQSFTRDKRPFVSAILEDFGGSIEVTAWAEVYERTRGLWQEGNTLLVKGKVKTRSDRIQLTCQSVSLYQPPKSEESVETTVAQLGPAPPHRRLKINLPTSDDTDADIARLGQLFDILKHFPGKDEVYLSIVGSEGVIDIEDTHRDVIMATNNPVGHGYNPDGYEPGVERHVDFLESYPPGSYLDGQLWGANRDETLSWFNRITTGVPGPHAIAEEGHRNLLLTMAMDLSARTGEVVKLPNDLNDLIDRF